METKQGAVGDNGTNLEGEAMFLDTVGKLYVGLVILFWNFEGNNFDLYDVIVKWLGG